MENFLATSPYKITFQPFARLGDFDDKIKEKHPGLTFLPDWYLKEFGRKLGFRPILTPIAKGAPSYRKVLLATKDADISVGSIKNHSLAMTSMGPAEKDIIAKTLFPGSELHTDTLNIILVPKDSDALIALSLKQVDMALVGQNTLELLTQINPKVVASTKIIAESEPIPLPTLCYRDGAVTSEQVAGIKELFMNADKSSEKPKIMEMLHIERWQPTSD